MTTNRAVILRPTITDWMMEKIHERAQGDRTGFIGIFLDGEDRGPEKAPELDGRRFECRNWNFSKVCEEVDVFREWDTVLDLQLIPKHGDL